MSWIRLDPQELALAGAQLGDIGKALEDSSQRVRSACCTAGLGRHAATLMVEGEASAATTVRITEDYLRWAIDTVLRSILAARENALVDTVSTVGSVATTSFPTGGIPVPSPSVRPSTPSTPRAPNGSGGGTRPPKTANEVALDAIAMRSAIKRANAVLGIGNPAIGYSKAGLATYEQTFGTTFMGHSSSDERP